jgi:diguanylate cyclase
MRKIAIIRPRFGQTAGMDGATGAAEKTASPCNLSYPIGHKHAGRWFKSLGRSPFCANKRLDLHKMTTSTYWIVFAGCLLGLIQLCAGVAIGMWLRRGGNTAAEQEGQQVLLDANRIAERLQALAGEVSTSVGEHQQRIEAASEKLTTDAAGDDESITELVVDVIGGIVRANHQLQTKLDTAESRLQEQAEEIQAHISRSLTDPLTGLANRREFNERLEERMAGWKRRGEVFSLFLLDVDHFKKLNDQYGHLAGDEVLRMLGRTLRSVLRRDDAVARYGGEEFAMILPGTTLAQAIGVVPKVCKSASQAAVNHGGVELKVTLSGGLATIRQGETAEVLIGRADEALYAAKAAGRDRVFLHDGDTCRPIAVAETGEHWSTDIANEVTFELLADKTISPELARTCQELRQFVRRHGQEEPEVAAGR